MSEAAAKLRAFRESVVLKIAGLQSGELSPDAFAQEMLAALSREPGEANVGDVEAAVYSQVRYDLDRTALEGEESDDVYMSIWSMRERMAFVRDLLEQLIAYSRADME